MFDNYALNRYVLRRMQGGAMIEIMALALQATSIAAGGEPSAKSWGVEYRADGCTISRPFGDGSEPAVLAVDADLVTGLGNIILILPQVTARRVHGAAIITTMPENASLRASWSAQSGKPGMGTFKLAISQAEWERILAADTIEIEGIAKVAIPVPVKGIAKAVDAAKACGRDLLQTWGFDPAAMIGLPQGQTLSWLSPDDYPSDAFRNRQQGIVRMVGTVNADGKPVACRVVVSSGVASLDNATCSAFMRRPNFDRSAASVRYVFHKMVWVNPN